MIGLKDIDGFEWGAGNIGKNFESHNISDREAQEIFGSNPLIVKRTAYINEERFQLMGELKSRFITVIFTIRNNKIRIISARDMSKKERKFYEEEYKEEAKARTGFQDRR